MNHHQSPMGADGNQYYPGYNVEPPQTNGKSIAALVLGILAVVIPYVGFIIGIVAIVIASMSFKEIKRTGDRGYGMAVAGLVCGIVGTALYGIIFLFVILAIASLSVL